jgi:prophage regulatory protein
MRDERSKGVYLDPANRSSDEDGFADLAETRRFAGAPSRTTLWRWCRQGRFPKPLKLGPNRRGWRRSELRAWARDPEGWAARAAKAGEPSDRED